MLIKLARNKAIYLVLNDAKTKYKENIQNQKTFRDEEVNQVFLSLKPRVGAYTNNFIALTNIYYQ